tara:strand:- start:555 stop:1022 length:468 start_codon:yes stop_codon:yes gene_type:complete
MALTLNSTYQNVFYDFVLDHMRDTLITEFNYGKIYIAPEKLYDDAFSIKLWGTAHRLDNFSAGEWVKEYDVLISFYAKLDNNEQSYKQFYADQERIFQCLHNEFKGVTAKTVSSTTIHLTNGQINEIDVLTPEDTNVENLFQAEFTFTVLANRGD